MFHQSDTPNSQSPVIMFKGNPYLDDQQHRVVQYNPKKKYYDAPLVDSQGDQILKEHNLRTKLSMIEKRLSQGNARFYYLCQIYFLLVGIGAFDLIVLIGGMIYVCVAQGRMLYSDGFMG